MLLSGAGAFACQLPVRRRSPSVRYKMFPLRRIITAVLTLGIAHALAQNPPAGGGYLLRGGTVHTISGPVIENGSVLVHNGKIIGVGKDLSAPEGFKVLDIRGQQVYPGMIDAASTIGLEKTSSEEASDARELGLLNPQLRAVTAINSSSEQIPAARSNGVTSAIEMPEGDLISGQMSIVHLDGSSNDAMTVVPSTAIHLRFPAIVTVPVPPHETDEEDEDPAKEIEPIPYADPKRGYDQKMRALNQFFEEASRYRQARIGKPKARLRKKGARPQPFFRGAPPLSSGPHRQARRHPGESEIRSTSPGPRGQDSPVRHRGSRARDSPSHPVRQERKDQDHSRRRL